MQPILMPALVKEVHNKKGPAAAVQRLAKASAIVEERAAVPFVEEEAEEAAVRALRTVGQGANFACE